MNDNFSSSCNALIFEFFNFKCSWAITWPFASFLSFLLGDNLNKIGYNEWWIEANTELSNDIFFEFWISI